MYAPSFGLAREPFSIAPDPRFLFMSERHREALAHLLFGLQGGGGFVLLTGEIGAGKTTVCRCFLEQLPAHCNVAYIFNPRLTVTELLRSVADEFRIEGLPPHASATVKDYLDPLNAFLLREHAAGRNNVLIIDEAQDLTPELLEQLRLLTNLETAERKLLQIVLIGQPELRTMLARPALAALAQRVIARYHLQALSAAETEAYVRHRLAVAGGTGPLPFDAGALRRIHQLARGVPRRINLLADRALLGAWSRRRERADRGIVDNAAREVFDEAVPRPRRLALAGAGLLAAAGLWAAAAHWPMTAPAEARRVVAAPAASAVSAATAPSAPASAAAIAPVPAIELDALWQRLDSDEAAAWRALAALWSDNPLAADPCAADQPLRCQRSTSLTLAQIRALDRPGLITLVDPGNRARPALLVGLRDRHALLRLGDHTHAVAIDALAARWRGDFATLMRRPADNEGMPDWIAAQLGAGEADAAALRARIAAFQRAQGLPADGVAGPLTLMQLNRAAGIDEPRLIIER
ncbi:AAA family ATPase [Aquincola sp. S2]|uniref:AAA family ATPase n=1 Tax=Pseudaquabacterium terrae TaxID=2732868 RepID=A0ABX2ETR8_9BURK|nr:ExeA family protein [Aquabacterium terrae]NRF72109.1 AAA family ATPase [Aquabacterium terrae]